MTGYQIENIMQMPVVRIGLLFGGIIFLMRTVMLHVRGKRGWEVLSCAALGILLALGGLLAEGSPHTYEVFPESMSWTDANTAAILRHSRLVEIECEEEWQAVTALLDENGMNMVWIGGGLDEEGTPKWYSGNDIAEEVAAHWAEGEPSGEAVLCLRRTDSGWIMADEADVSLVGQGVGYIVEYNDHFG